MQVNAAGNRVAILYTGIEDENYLLADQATDDTVATVVLPPYLNDLEPMIGKIAILPGGTTADVPAGDVDIEGTDLQGAAQTEAITLLANQSSAEDGVKVWKSITKITFPSQDGADATYDVGLQADLDIVIAGKSKRLIEVRLALDSASATAEQFNGVAEYVDDGTLDFEVHTVDMNTIKFRREEVDYDLIVGVQMHWLWANTNEEPFGFAAIYELM